MKPFRHIFSMTLAGVLAVTMPVTAFAGSPEFARTAEEWARLRDNVIEYDELEDLIQEYNVTVQTNQLDLNEFKQKYGNTRTDVSDKYRDMANEIYSSVDYPETDDPMYGFTAPGVLSAEIQAKNLEKQADDNLEDSEIIYLNYKSAEKTLVTVAQSNMISYHKGLLELEQAEIARKQAETKLASAQISLNIGMSTGTETMTVQESLMTAVRNIDKTKSDIENVRQKLQVMLGWKHGDMPEIREIPAADMSRIEKMNPDADKAAALENNYTLKVNKKKKENAESANVRESQQRTIEDNERKIGSSLVTCYQNVLAAKLAYDQAVADLELARRNMQSMEVQYSQGNVSYNQYVDQQFTVQTKEIAVKIADLSLFQTMETYDWAVAGLASVS